MATQVLYTHTSSLIGGGNKVILRLFEKIDRSRFSPISVIPEPGPLEIELKRLDVPYFILDLRPKAQARASTVATVIKYTAQCLRYRVRILHANDPFTYRIGSIGMASLANPRICHVHHPGNKPNTFRWSFRRPPALVITPSLFMKQEVSRLLRSVCPIRTETVFNQVDTTWFLPAEDINKLRNRLGFEHHNHICIVGALAPHKGHVCFLRMANLILPRFPKTTFHIVGSAKAGSEAYALQLKQLASDLGILSHIRFWGFVSDELARDILRASDLFVLPTTEEGFGLAVAEAQACQVPVLSSRIRPLDEVVNNGQTGFLLNPEDYERFAIRCIDLLGSEVARRSMGVAGRSWVIQRFGMQQHAERIMALYEEILSQGFKYRQPDSLGRIGR